ncbi:unnamed protein product [Owenia fusiformis]|uniref:Myb-like domain-containing protein n=1 Tax=Owenia fusiformis TaxID=6347 RepID=A0A8S4P203_OWEFU|nr:unnamed protein product [Owenia fusiformis]
MPKGRVTKNFKENPTRKANYENQRYCSTIFPHAFQYLESTLEGKFLRPIASLIGLAVSNNIYNQDRMNKCGGFDCLMNVLHRLENRVTSDLRAQYLAVHITNTIDAAISDNAENGHKLRNLGGIPVLLRLLGIAAPDNKMSFVLTLAHCAETAVENQVEILHNNGVNQLLELMRDSSDEELNHTVRYMLQNCLSEECQQKMVAMSSSRLMAGGDAELSSLNSTAHLKQRQDELRIRIDELSKQLDSSTDVHKCNITSQHIQAPVCTKIEKELGNNDTNSSSFFNEEPYKLSKPVKLLKSLAEPLETKSLVGDLDMDQTVTDYSKQHTKYCQKIHHQLMDAVKEVISSQNSGKNVFEPSKIESNCLSRAFEGPYNSDLKTLSKYVEEPVSNKSIFTEIPYTEQFRDLNEVVEGTRATHVEDIEPVLQVEESTVNNQEFNSSSGSNNNQVQTTNSMDNTNNTNDENLKQVQNTRGSNKPGLALNNNVETLRVPSDSIEVINLENLNQVHHSMTEHECTSTYEPQLSEGTNKFKEAKSKDEELFRRPYTPRYRHSIRDQERSAGKLRLILPKSKKVKLNYCVDEQRCKISSINSSPKSDISELESEFDFELLRKANISQKYPNITRTPFSVKPKPRKVLEYNFETADVAISDVIPESDRDHWCGLEYSTTYGLRNDDLTKSQDTDELSICSNLLEEEVESLLDVSGAYCEDHVELCPGCSTSTFGGLNSRNFNIALETSIHTCDLHLLIRQHERCNITKINVRRQPIGKPLQETPSATEVYTFRSNSSSSSKPKAICRPRSISPSLNDEQNIHRNRRQRVAFTGQELDNLQHGVKQLGKFWHQILNTYHFHPSRTAVDIMEKYKRLMLQKKQERNWQKSKQKNFGLNV